MRCSPLWTLLILGGYCCRLNGEVGCLFRLLFLNDDILKVHYRHGRTYLSPCSTQRHESQPTQKGCSHSYTVSQLIIRIPSSSYQNSCEAACVPEKWSIVSQPERIHQKRLDLCCIPCQEGKLYGTFLKLANIPWEVKQGN